MKKVSIIIPCYNEESNLMNLYQNLASFMNEHSEYLWQILLINDGSRDHTFEIIKDIRTKDKRFCYIHLSRNFGKENAMLAGFDHDDLRMMEAGLVDPYLASLLLQLVTVIEDTVRCKGYVAWLCYHYLHCDASLHGICQRPSYLRYKSEIGVYEAYSVFA